MITFPLPTRSKEQGYVKTAFYDLEGKKICNQAIQVLRRRVTPSKLRRRVTPSKVPLKVTLSKLRRRAIRSKHRKVCQWATPSREPLKATRSKPRHRATVPRQWATHPKAFQT